MHEHFQDLLPYYVAGTLDRGARAALEHHLRDCAACRAHLAEWQAVAAAVRTEAAARLPAQATLPPLGGRVRAQLLPQFGPPPPPSLDTTRSIPVRVPPAPRRPEPVVSWWGASVGAAAVLTVVVLGSLFIWLAGRFTQEPPATPPALVTARPAEVALLITLELTLRPTLSITGTPAPSATPPLAAPVTRRPVNTALPPRTAVPTQADAARQAALPTPSDSDLGILAQAAPPDVAATPTATLSGACVAHVPDGQTASITRAPDAAAPTVALLSADGTPYRVLAAAPGWVLLEGADGRVLGWAEARALVLGGGTCVSLPGPTATATPSPSVTPSATALPFDPL